jgi:uncharacterized membrane protein
MAAQYGTWVSYAGTARLLLAIILLAAAGGLAYAGTRFRHPVRVPSPGRVRTLFMILAWVIALGALVTCWTAYVRQEMHEHIAKTPPANPITMVTLTAAVVLFVVVFIATPRGLGYGYLARSSPRWPRR